jgi:hypothetical protein
MSLQVEEALDLLDRSSAVMGDVEDPATTPGVPGVDRRTLVIDDEVRLPVADGPILLFLRVDDDDGLRLRIEIALHPASLSLLSCGTGALTTPDGCGQDMNRKSEAVEEGPELIDSVSERR